MSELYTAMALLILIQNKEENAGLIGNDDRIMMITVLLILHLVIQ